MWTNFTRSIGPGLPVRKFMEYKKKIIHFPPLLLYQLTCLLSTYLTLLYQTFKSDYVSQSGRRYSIDKGKYDEGNEDKIY